MCLGRYEFFFFLTYEAEIRQVDRSYTTWIGSARLYNVYFTHVFFVSLFFKLLISGGGVLSKF